MTVGTVGQSDSHTGKLDIWLGIAHLLHICRVMELELALETKVLLNKLLRVEILVPLCKLFDTF